MSKPIPELVQRERKRWLFFGIPFTFTKYTITEKKLTLNEGFFTSVENEVLLYRILDITLKRTLIQKMFGLGTVIIQSQDKSHPTLYAKNIKRSVQFKENLSSYVEKEKSRLNMRRGEYIHGNSQDMDHDGIDDDFENNMDFDDMN